MGKVEKFVVLTVLLLIAVILAVSLNSGGDPGAGPMGEAYLAGAPPASDPPEEGGFRFVPRKAAAEAGAQLDGRDLAGRAPDGEDGSAGGPGGRALQPGEAERGPQRGPALLQSEVELAPRRQPDPEPLPEPPADWDVLTLEGLEETRDPDLWLYACAAGDDFESLARRLYGDAAKADVLRLNNEGIERPAAGQRIFVPVRLKAAAAPAGEYVVRAGDNLWGIAKRLYGQGSRWQELFDANRGVLQTPEALREGMVLRVP